MTFPGIVQPPAPRPTADRDKVSPRRVGKAAAVDTSTKFDIVAVGTTNACKVSAVRASIHEFQYSESGTDAFGRAVVEPHKVPSDVSEQPMTLLETSTGSMNRAKHAYDIAVDRSRAKEPSPAILAIGIESGLQRTELDARMYDVCVCTVFDGKKYHQGMSCSFEIPPPILRFVIEKGMDLSQACKAAGVTANPKLGEAEGIIGILSKGRVKRLDYTKQAIAMAFLVLENSELYARSVPHAASEAKSSPVRVAASPSDIAAPFHTNGTRVGSPRSQSKGQAARNDVLARINEAARGKCGVPFELDLKTLIRAFGEPGSPQWCGTHSVDETGEHVITVEGASALEVLLGDSPVVAAVGRITLRHDGGYFARMYTETTKGQSNLLAALERGCQPTAKERALAAAAEAAAHAALHSQKDPFVVEDDSDKEGGAADKQPPAKRQRCCSDSESSD